MRINNSSQYVILSNSKIYLDGKEEIDRLDFLNSLDNISIIQIRDSPLNSLKSLNNVTMDSL